MPPENFQVNFEFNGAPLTMESECDVPGILFSCVGRTSVLNCAAFTFWSLNAEQSTKVEFHEILSQFRTLGGVAENFTMRHGTHGKGLFSVNPRLPIQLHVPTPLLIDPHWIELDRTDNIRIAPKYQSLLSAKAIVFFEEYHAFFGWGNGGFDSVKQHQQDWQALPPKLKNFLHILGAADELSQVPTAKYCLQKYCIARQIGFKSGSRLMPVAELINHAPDGLPFVLADGVKVTGMAKDEVLTRYHSHLDAFHFFVNYHFVTPANSALSCEVTVEVPSMGSLKIARMDHLADVHGSVRTPKISKTGTHTNLSFVEIANLKDPSQPRATFANLIKTQDVPLSMAHALFDGIIEHNQQVLNELIQVCHRHPSAMASKLEKVASFQLATIG